MTIFKRGPLGKKEKKRKKTGLEEENKKSTLRAFALRANKPFAGKFPKD